MAPLEDQEVVLVRNVMVSVEQPSLILCLQTTTKRKAGTAHGYISHSLGACGWLGRSFGVGAGIGAIAGTSTCGAENVSTCSKAEHAIDRNLGVYVDTSSISNQILHIALFAGFILWLSATFTERSDRRMLQALCHALRC